MNRRIACVRFPSPPTGAPAPTGEALAALAGALLQAAPRITAVREHPCAFWADAAGMARRGGDAAVGRALLEAARRAGADAARVGVAGCCIAAAAATRERGTALRVVPPGRDAAYLARRPLAVLPLGGVLRDALALLGLRRCAELAALPPAEVELRFGAEGLHAWRLARGEDDRWPFRPAPAAGARAEVELEPAVESLEALRFVIPGLIAAVAAQLAIRQRIPGGLLLTLRMEDAPDDARTVRPARPTADARVLADLCRRALEARPPAAAVRGVALAAQEEAGPRADQLDAFTAPAPDPGALHAAVLPVLARWGDGAMSDAVRQGAHLPGEHALWRARGSEGIARFSAHALPDGALRSGEEPPPFRNTLPLLLRRLAAPLPLRVREGRGRRPAELSLPPGNNALRDGDLRTFPPALWKIRSEGPERISGRWWGAAAAREYWRVESAEGLLALVYRDPETGAWYLEGWYD
jgi:protein ImuB